MELINLKSDVLHFNQLTISNDELYEIPFFEDCVSAGFPSPAQHEMENKCDLNSLLIKHPSATFFVRASGHSMVGVGIHDKDILIVDRSVQPTSGKVVIAAVNGELTVKKIIIEKGKAFLVAANEDYPPIEITESMELHVWGVVTSVIHNL